MMVAMSRVIHSFLRGFLRGLAAPAEIYAAPRYKRDASSDVERMRSDWESIGKDFRKVISRTSEAGS
jgi:hypothetical protein